MNDLTRRDFLKSSAATTTALAVVARPAVPAPPPGPAPLRAEILPVQPLPTACTVLHGFGPYGPTTTVARVWKPEDAARCRLCPRQLCGVGPTGLCMIKLNRFVPDAECVTIGLDAPAGGVRC